MKITKAVNRLAELDPNYKILQNKLSSNNYSKNELPNNTMHNIINFSKIKSLVQKYNSLKIRDNLDQG